MEITYTDYNGKEITYLEVPYAKDRIKVFKENGRLKKEEFYLYHLLNQTLNYIEYGASHLELLALNPSKLIVIEMENIDNNYIRFHSYLYRFGRLVDKGIEIRTSTELCIMSQEIDMDTDLPIYERTYKYYELDGYELEFKYHETGELLSIIVSNDSVRFYEQYRFSELNMIPHFESWKKYLSYYLNAEPAIPDDIIIT